MRAFVAIPLDALIKRAIEALSHRLRDCGTRPSWVRPENMHLTLRFFGDINDGQAAQLTDRLAEAYTNTPPCVLRVRGVGVFPNIRRPSVAWVGIEPVEDRLAPLYAATERAARAIGLPPDGKAFHPHVTLARIRDPRHAQPLMDAMEHEADFDAGEFEAGNVTLFSSELTPKGPIYQVVREFLL